MQVSTRRFLTPCASLADHVFWRCSYSRNICCDKPVLAGKVTCGVRNETSGRSWRSNTVVTDPFRHGGLFAALHPIGLIVSWAGEQCQPLAGGAGVCVRIFLAHW